MMDFLRDLRLGFRLLLRAPGFAVTAILTLALGIGATTALFTVVNAVLLEPLPFPDSNKLVQVWRSELPALTYGSASYARYLDWRQHQRVFTDLGAWSPRGITIAGPQGPERVPGAMASASFFKVDQRAAGDRPLFLGRRGSAAAASASSSSAKGCGSGASSNRRRCLGTPLQIDGEPYTIDRRRAVRLLRSVAARCLDGARPGWPIRTIAAATSCCRSDGCATA